MQQRKNYYEQDTALQQKNNTSVYILQLSREVYQFSWEIR